MQDWDERLGVSTEGVDYSVEDSKNYGYDPTPYCVLEALLGLGLIDEDSVVVDYGCGKGRVGFFLASQTGCRVIGIDRSLKLLEVAEDNLERYSGRGDVVFVCSDARNFIPDGANCLYFFNPFSTSVFRDVLERISESYKRNPREILIIFYYSTIEYRLYLPTEPHLELLKSLEFSSVEVNGPADARLDVFRFADNLNEENSNGIK